MNIEFQDLAVVPLLALASLLAVSDLTIEEDIGLALLEAVIILALIILGDRYLLQPILQRVDRYGSPEIFTASALINIALAYLLSLLPKGMERIHRILQVRQVSLPNALSTLSI